MTTLDELRDLVVRFRDEREWAQFHTPKNLAMGIAIEAAELGELFLWKSDAESAQALADPAMRERFEDELADVMIYVLLLSANGKVDLADALRRKLVKNAAKYPVEKARGNAKKYTEL